MLRSGRLRRRALALGATVGVVGAGLVTASASSAAGGSASWQPSHPAVFLVSTGVGGGGDLFARAAAAGIAKREGIQISVQNHVGGSEVVGDEYALSKKGNPYYLWAGNSSLTLIPYSIVPPPNYTWRSFTPIAELAEDQQLLVVPASSPYHSLKQLIAAAKKKTLRVAVTSATGTDNAVAREIERDKHVKFQHVILESGASSDQALLAGNAEFSMLNPSEALQELEAHKLRALAVFATKRYPKGTVGGLSNVPTARQQGVNVVFSQWRALFGPPGLTKTEVAYWLKAAHAWTKTASYQKYIKENVLFPAYAHGSAFTHLMNAQANQMKAIFGKK